MNFKSFNKIYSTVAKIQKFKNLNFKNVRFQRVLLTFQQDNAPAHRARETVQLSSGNTPEIISPMMWPPNSQISNPVDYEVWGVLPRRLYRTRILDVDHLKQRIVEERHQSCTSVRTSSTEKWDSHHHHHHHHHYHVFTKTCDKPHMLQYYTKVSVNKL